MSQLLDASERRGQTASWRDRASAALSSPVDAAGLAFFRIAFGLILAWEASRYLRLGWVDRYFVDTTFRFSYGPFDFVDPWPGWGIKAHFVVLLIVGLTLAAGLFYRLSAVLAFVGITYVFLLDKALYLNHLYLVCLLAFLMIFLPAGQIWSIDAWRDRGERARVVPAWTLWLLRFQLGAAYFFGGIAKLNADWIRDGEPLRTWLSLETDFPLIGHLFRNDAVARFMSVGALLLDLCVVPLLLIRRTRPFAYTAAVLFHLLNSRLFHIGIFPWLMIAATVIFFPPDWPRRALRDLKDRPTSPRSVAFWVGFNLGAAVGGSLPTRFEFPILIIGGFGGAVALFSLVELIRPMPEPEPEPAQEPERSEAVEPSPPPDAATRPLRRAVAVALAVWVGLQVLIPLRHLVMPGNVYWTDRGQRYSWMMMAHSKMGETFFEVTDVSRGETWEVDPSEVLFFYQVDAMQGRPDMILEFAHYLRDRLHDEGVDDVEIRARTRLMLNFGEIRPFIDPTVDLAKEKWPVLGQPDWVLPEP